MDHHESELFTISYNFRNDFVLNASLVKKKDLMFVSSLDLSISVKAIN